MQREDCVRGESGGAWVKMYLAEEWTVGVLNMVQWHTNVNRVNFQDGFVIVIKLANL